MSRYVRWEGAGPLACVWLDVERAVKIKDEAGNIIEPDDELEETGSCGADLCANMIIHYMHGGPEAGLVRTVRKAAGTWPPPEERPTKEDPVMGAIASSLHTMRPTRRALGAVRRGARCGISIGGRTHDMTLNQTQKTAATQIRNLRPALE